MRRAGAILAATIDRVLAAVAPGVTTLDLDRIAPRRSAEAGATSNFLGYGGRGGQPPFPGTICASINDEIVHGIPSADRVLAEGRPAVAGLRRDLGGVPLGLGGHGVRRRRPPSDDAERLVKTTEAALDAAIATVRPGGRLSDIGHAIEQVARRPGSAWSASTAATASAGKMHEDPFIQNWGPPGRGPELRPGLTIAIEPMLNLGGDDTAVMPDGWTVVTADGSLSAHFEHTVAVTEDGHEILTARR